MPDIRLLNRLGGRTRIGYYKSTSDITRLALFISLFFVVLILILSDYLRMYIEISYIQVSVIAFWISIVGCVMTLLSIRSGRRRRKSIPRITRFDHIAVLFWFHLSLLFLFVGAVVVGTGFVSA